MLSSHCGLDTYRQNPISINGFILFPLLVTVALPNQLTRLEFEPCNRIKEYKNIYAHMRLICNMCDEDILHVHP